MPIRPGCLPDDETPTNLKASGVIPDAGLLSTLTLQLSCARRASAHGEEGHLPAGRGERRTSLSEFDFSSVL